MGWDKYTLADMKGSCYPLEVFLKNSFWCMNGEPASLR